MHLPCPCAMLVLLTMAPIVTAQAETQPAPGIRPAVIYLVPQPDPRQIADIHLPMGPYPINSTVPPDQIAQDYSCVIRLDSDSDLMPGFATPVDSQSASALVTSSALLDPATKSVLNLPPKQRWDSVIVNVSTAGARLARIEVILRKTGTHFPEDGAEKLVYELIRRLKSAYAASSEAAQKAAAARRDPVEKELADITAKADQLRQQQRDIHAQAASLDVPNGQAAVQLNNLRSQKRNLEQDLARNRARLLVLEPAASPQVSEWAAVVKARQTELDQIKASAATNKATADQVQDAESKLAEAKAQLAQARQPQPQDNVNPQFRASELANLHASVADAESRLKQLDAQIDKLSDPKFQAAMDSLPDLQNAEFRYRNRAGELQQRLENIRRSTQNEGTVTITVLDGRDHPDEPAKH